jgi:hypothetical protein
MLPLPVMSITSLLSVKRIIVSSWVSIDRKSIAYMLSVKSSYVAGIITGSRYISNEGD